MPVAGRCLFLIAFAAAWAFGGVGVAAAAAPANDTCMMCHADKAAKNDQGKSLGVEAAAYKASVHGEMQLACTMCHADAADPKTAHPGKLKAVDCSGCHDKAAGQFRGTVHGKALKGAAQGSAPTCSNCHGVHDIRPKADQASRTNRAKVPDMCGACHKPEREAFVKGMHGKLRQDGVLAAPGCTDCHSAHGIQQHDAPKFQVDVIKECGTCHTDYLSTYRDTFHGQVTELGYARMATCASCHGAHDILPASNPASMVSKENRVKTCQTCHPGASANFASFDPHADKHNKARDPIYWYAARFMEILLLGVFAFFGIHTVFWLYREVREVLGGSRGKGKERH
jgi:hypothetical protein